MYKKTPRAYKSWSFALKLSCALLAMYVLSGCAEQIAEPGQTSSGRSEEYPTVRLEDVRDRALELQHRVYELMPKEAIEGNDLPTIEELGPQPVSSCRSYLDEGYAGPDDKSVYHTRWLSVKVDLDASADEVAEETYRAVVLDLGLPGSDENALPSGNSYPLVQSEDGFNILISKTEIADEQHDQISVAVASPCFIPEGGTLPPGDRI